MSKLPYCYLICTLVAGTGIDFSCSNQGRCRVFESGPADETIECRKIETWESTRDPLSMVAFVRAPRRKRILTAYLCVLNAFFAEFGTRFQNFVGLKFLLKKCKEQSSELRQSRLCTFL